MALTKITSAVLSGEFSSSTSLISATTVDIDWNSFKVFTLTPNEAITLTFSDYKVGMVKILVATGAAGSGALTFPSEAIDLAGTAFDNTSGVKNFIQMICTSESGNGQFFYTITQPST
tara:strand:- start:61 stop:414 length:354 start_codon:yes stop_codon:yes gene_type:complete